jgi:aromatic ring-opening dioxygenase catalytic subunit (LigB family)
LRSFFAGGDASSATFDAWLDATAKAPGAEREERLAAWDKAPGARAAHPREEHLIPLMVVAGAAGDSEGRHAFKDVIGGKTISGFEFR